ncbi:hypothetical protein [Streptomyces sannanensis]|uniref:hypothetical protein n=1 Tax=Streptomyces sannanensis TaxID=285536 RepID=UPI0031EEA63F
MQARKVALFCVIIFVLYTIITSPKESADMVGIGFKGISDAAKGIGEFMTELVR